MEIGGGNIRRRASEGRPRELAIILLLIAVIAPLPWLFGGVYTSTQVMLASGVALLLLLRLLAGCSAEQALPWALLPLLFGLGLGLLHLVPLGDSLAAVSPQSHTFWAAAAVDPAVEPELAMRLGDLAAPPTTISVYPSSTIRDLALLSVAVGLFFLASQFLSRRQWLPLLFAAVAINGTLFAFFGIAQQLVWTGHIYGVEVPRGRPFAAFVNSNNAGGYLNMCMAAAIGFLLYACASSPTGQSRSSHWFTQLRERVVHEVAHIDGRRLLAVTMMIVLFVGILSTLSRGAWLSMLCATAVVVTILIANNGRKYAVGLTLAVVILGLGMIDWLGRMDAVHTRWDQLKAEIVKPSDGRLAHWQDGLQAAGDFWLLGSGLGTYRFVYRPYATTNDVWFYHAENQYVEALCEGGIVGLGLLLTAVVALALACHRLLRDGDRIRWIAGIVGTYALVSQGVHALFDFGLYLPANMALFAVLCGAIAGASQRCRVGARWDWGSVQEFVERGRAVLARSDLQAGLAALLFVAVLLGAFDLQRTLAVETSLPRNTDLEAMSLAVVDERLQELSAALSEQPSHAEGQAAASQLWVRRYRLRAVEPLRSAAPLETTDEQLWQVTSPLALHGTVHRYNNQGRTLDLQDLRRSEQVQTDLTAAARASAEANRGCPLLPASQLLLAEVSPVLASDAADAPRLSRIPALAGGNTFVLKECAAAQLQSGQVDDGLRTLGRLVEVDPGELAASLALAGLVTDAESALAGIAPMSIDLLVDTASSPEFADNPAMRKALSARASSLLAASQLEPADRSRLEGALHALQGQDERAIEELQKAVTSRPEMTAWRYELATLLRKQGDIEGAWEHARTCVRMEPSNEQFDDLLRQLNRLRLR